MPRLHIGSNSQSSNHSSPSDGAPADIPLPAFLRQNRSDIQGKFVDLEWQQRDRLHKSHQTPTSDTVARWTRVSGDDVVRRNRYMNVDPFVDNRIHLKVPEGHSDYINASPIHLQLSKSKQDSYFIATQGPKEGSYSHIWRMIWHETADPAVIVMLTQTHESGREKCFQYFPQSMDAPTLDINEQDEFEDNFLASLELLSVQEDPSSRSTIRELELRTADGRSKKVWHLLFAGWPDFLIPEGDDRAALLNLVRLSAEKNLHTESPRIVHCSAGVGRSGTFIALDWLLAELADGSLDVVGDDDDPITDLVDLLRQQRMMMVQGEQQFGFLYDVLREKWTERWRAQQQNLDASTAGSGHNNHPTGQVGNHEESKNGTGETVAPTVGTSSGGASESMAGRTAVSPLHQVSTAETSSQQRQALELEMRDNVEQIF